MDKRRLVEEALAEIEVDECIILDGLDSAIAGIGSQYGKPTLIVYDEALVIKTLVDDQEMTLDEAWEYYEYNIKHAYYGEGTPIIMQSMDTLAEHFGFNNADVLLGEA
jgi:hypothetical protein